MNDPNNPADRLEPEPDAGTVIADTSGGTQPTIVSPARSVSQRRAFLEKMALRKSGTKWARSKKAKPSALPDNTLPIVTHDIVSVKKVSGSPPAPLAGELEFRPTSANFDHPKAHLDHPRASLDFEEQAGIDAAVLQSRIEAGLVSKEMSKERGVQQRRTERDAWVKAQSVHTHEQIAHNTPKGVNAPQYTQPDQSALMIASLVAKITDMHVDLKKAIDNVDEKVDKNAYLMNPVGF